MSKEFSYVLLTGQSLYATQFKSDFEQNNTSKITIGVGHYSNQIPYYIIKNNKEYIYPFTSKWFRVHNFGFSSFNSTNILEEFKELRDREYSNILNNSKQIISNAINEKYEKQIPSTYTNLDNIFKGEQNVVNPENIHIVLEKGKLNVYYDGIYKSNSIICEEGEIYIYKRYSDIWLQNVIVDNVVCKNFNVSSNKLITVNKLKTEIINFNSNLIIEQLDCNKPVKIKVSNKDCNIQIKNILGDKNNISVEMDTKYTTEDVVNIEGKPYSQWKTKAQTTGKNSTIYPIKGKTFIATGKIIIGQYNTRDQIYSLIKAAGGNIAKSKEHYYDYLVTDKHFTHGDNSSSKLEDAERRGIIPISGAQLEEMLRNEGVIQ